MKLLAIVALTATASAEPAKPRVDWARGLVIATGVGVADRHAPSPEVARGTARRGAEDAAKKQLAEMVATLPLAAGGKVADKLADATIKARVDAAVEHAITVSADPETDGAWTVSLAVPVEAVRQAIAGPRTIASGKGGDRTNQVVIVDGAKVSPSIGALAAPTLFVKDVPAWAKSATHVKAKAVKGSAIELDGVDAAIVYLIVAP